MPAVAGVDLAAGRGVSAVAVLACRGGYVPRFVAQQSGEVQTDDDVLSALAVAAPDIIAIDAPLSLPAPITAALRGLSGRDLRHLSPYTRAAERDPLWSSIGVRPLPVSFLGGLTFRAIALLPRLRETLPNARIIEVFPTATLRVLGIGRHEPAGRRMSKTTPAVRTIVQTGLRAVIDGLPEPGDHLLGADLLDALAAALTAARHQEGSTRALGDPDEGQIVVPLPPGPDVGQQSRVL